MDISVCASHVVMCKISCDGIDSYRNTVARVLLSTVDTAWTSGVVSACKVCNVDRLMEVVNTFGSGG